MDDNTTFKARRFAHAKAMQVAYFRTDINVPIKYFSSVAYQIALSMGHKKLGMDYLVNRAYLRDSLSYPSYSLSQTLSSDDNNKLHCDSDIIIFFNLPW